MEKKNPLRDVAPRPQAYFKKTTLCYPEPVYVIEMALHNPVSSQAINTPIAQRSCVPRPTGSRGWSWGTYPSGSERRWDQTSESSTDTFLLYPTRERWLTLERTWVGASRISRRPTVSVADLRKPREKGRAIDIKLSLTGSVSVWLRQEGSTGLALRERKLKS